MFWACLKFPYFFPGNRHFELGCWNHLCKIITLCLKATEVFVAGLNGEILLLLPIHKAYSIHKAFWSSQRWVGARGGSLSLPSLITNKALHFGVLKLQTSIRLCCHLQPSTWFSLRMLLNLSHAFPCNRSFLYNRQHTKLHTNHVLCCKVLDPKGIQFSHEPPP